MKTVYLLACYNDHNGSARFFGADLFFSNGADTLVAHGYNPEPKRVCDIFTHPLDHYIPIEVHDDFSNMDYVPENY